MAAQLIPFRRASRRGFIRKHSAIMARISPGAAERHLARQMLRRAETMAGATISAEEVDRQITALANEICVGVWNSSLPRKVLRDRRKEIVYRAA